MEERSFHIQYGVGEDEDFIVGDKEGLTKLKSAITEAIKDGKSFTDLDEFYGIRCHKKDFFEKRPIHQTSLIQNFFILLFILSISTIFISGIYTVGAWFFNN